MKRFLIFALSAAMAVSCSVLKMDKARTVVVIGDSYSTFENYIPEGYACWYFPQGRQDNDVTDVSQTWWRQLCDANGLKLIANNSFSGSTVCNTGYRGEDYTHESFITRMPLTLHYKSDGFNEQGTEKNDPDILFIFGGTNDSWAGSPIGEIKYSDWTEKELYSFLPAFCKLLDFYKREAPSTRVIVLVNDGLKQEISSGMKQVCDHFGVECLMLDGIDKGSGHPTVKGMSQIRTAIESIL